MADQLTQLETIKIAISAGIIYEAERTADEQGRPSMFNRVKGRVGQGVSNLGQRWSSTATKRGSQDYVPVGSRINRTASNIRQGASNLGGRVNRGFRDRVTSAGQSFRDAVNKRQSQPSVPLRDRMNQSVSNLRQKASDTVTSARQGIGNLGQKAHEASSRLESKLGQRMSNLGQKWSNAAKPAPRNALPQHYQQKPQAPQQTGPSFKDRIGQGARTLRDKAAIAGVTTANMTKRGMSNIGGRISKASSNVGNRYNQAVQRAQTTRPATGNFKYSRGAMQNTAKSTAPTRPVQPISTKKLLNLQPRRSSTSPVQRTPTKSNVLPLRSKPRKMGSGRKK